MGKLTRRNLALADRHVFECANSRSYAEMVYESYGLDVHRARVLTDLRLTYTPSLFQKMPASEFDQQTEPPPPLKAKRLDAQVREHSWAYHEKQWEAEATKLCGPPEVRARKNQRYADRLVRRYSEPVIRGLLSALSRLDRPLCAHWLSEMDLTTIPLTEIIQPFDLGGRRFVILSLDGTDYTIKISAGHGTAGDGGEFVVTRTGGDTFAVKDALREWIS